MENVGKSNENRGGNPSGSGFEGYSLCAGKFLLEQKHGVDNSTDISRSGDRIHHCLETGKDKDKLTPRELDICNSCEQHALTARDMVFKGEKPDGEYAEQRLWSRNKKYSGQSDLTAYKGPRYLVLDYKTGPKAVPHARVNKQLKCLAALTYQKYKKDGCTEVVVCIVQPLAGPPTYHLYEEADLKRAVSWANALVRRITTGTPKLKAGETQCKYCKAKTACPALAGEAESLSQIKSLDMLSPSQLGQALEKAAAVKGLIKELEDRAKELLEEDPNSVEGFELREGAKRRSVKDSRDTIGTLLNAGIIDELVMADCVKVELGKVESAVADAQGISLPKAKLLVAETIGDKITTSKGAKRLCPTG